MNESREVTKHSLQAHVLRFAGRLDLAADVEIPCSVVQFGNRHGRVHSLTHVKHFSRVRLGHDGSAIGNQLPGSLLHGPNQPDCSGNSPHNGQATADSPKNGRSVAFCRRRTRQKRALGMRANSAANAEVAISNFCAC